MEKFSLVIYWKKLLQNDNFDQQFEQWELSGPSSVLDEDTQKNLAKQAIYAWQWIKIFYYCEKGSIAEKESFKKSIKLVDTFEDKLALCSVAVGKSNKYTKEAFGKAFKKASSTDEYLEIYMLDLGKDYNSECLSAMEAIETSFKKWQIICDGCDRNLNFSLFSFSVDRMFELAKDQDDWLVYFRYI